MKQHFGQYIYEVAKEREEHKGEFEVINSDHNFGVKGENFEVMFSYLNDGLVSYRYGGVEMIKAIPKPNFWRTPTDNDEGNLMPMRMLNGRLQVCIFHIKNHRTKIIRIV